MEQFVLIPQHLYEQKFKLEVKKLDTFEKKPVSVPTLLNPYYKEISKKKQILKERINCRSNFEFTASQAISQRHNFIRWKRYRSSFRRFYFCIKQKER